MNFQYSLAVLVLSLGLLANGRTINPESRTSILEGIKELVQGANTDAQVQVANIKTAHENVLAYAAKLNAAIATDFQRSIGNANEIITSLETLITQWVDPNVKCPMETFRTSVQELEALWTKNHFVCTETHYLENTRQMKQDVETIETALKSGEEYVKRATDCGNELVCLNDLYREILTKLPELKQQVIDVALDNTRRAMEINGKILLCDSDSVQKLAASADVTVKLAVDCVKTTRHSRY